MQGQCLTENWPAFRTWGVDGVTAWTLQRHWNPKAPVTTVEQLKVDWEKLQHPGYSPDFVNPKSRRWDIYGAEDDWVPDQAALAIMRYSQPALAWLAGKSAHFTGRDHNFTAGESFEKQAILINNSRQHVTGDCAWSLALPQTVTGSKQVSLETGQMEKTPRDAGHPGGDAGGAV